MSSSGHRPVPFAIMGAIAAALAAPSAVVHEIRSPHEDAELIRRATKQLLFMPTFGGDSRRSPNGGHRRKVAMRAARLRNGGRCRFGKFR